VPNPALQFEPVSGQSHRRQRIYVLEDGEPRRVYVNIGSSDGKRTEVFANGLEPGDQVIIGWRDATSGADRTGR
jgi:HlyD family secretion protein